MMSHYTLSFSLFLLILYTKTSFINAEMANRNKNRTGPIDISFADCSNSDDYYCNPNRILFVFNRTCAQQLQNRNRQNEANDDAIEQTIQHIRNKYKMCMKVTHNSQNVTHYDTSKYSYAFFDLTCSYYSLNKGNHSNITIDYNDLCIVNILYEPLYKLPQTTETDIIETVPTNTAQFACMRLNTAYYKSYGMDLLDSDSMDYKYSFPQFTNNTIANQHKIDLHILDSGIQSNHMEFYSYQIVHEMGDGPAVFDDRTYGDHGTHVCGIAAGKNYGASRNFTVYDYRVCEFTADGKEMPCHGALIFEALSMVYNRIKQSGKPAVINLSLGGKKVLPEDAYHYYFEDIISVGGIPVVAAGNENVDACTTSPAYTTNAITVGSYDRDRKKSGFSNWGKCVDIWAPGTSIYSSIASSADDKYEYKQGTSMASPYVAGMVANLLYINPQLKFNDIKTIILGNNNRKVSSGVCDNDFDCPRAEYTCQSTLVYDLPHVWTTLEIVLITLACITGVCIITLIILWIVKKKKQKDKQEYENDNWQYNQKAYDKQITNDTDSEAQHINPNTEGKGKQQHITTQL